MSTTSNKQLSDPPLTMTLQPSVFFVKGLQDALPTAAKIYKKDPQTLPEAIRMDEKLNAAQQLTAMLTPFMVSMMYICDSCFVNGMGHFGHHFPEGSVTVVMNLVTLHKTGPTSSFLRNTMPPRQVSFKFTVQPPQRDRSDSTHYGHRHWRHFNQ